MNRRGFLAATAVLTAAPGWANAASPVYLSAARKPDGRYALFGLSAEGQSVFEIALPDRGHAAAARQTHPEAVAFARRPGTFALIIDCAEGRETMRLDAPTDRHFYGHGTFSQDGKLLFTTENAFETGEGRIGIWDAAERYKRIGEVSSGGIGPHDVKLMPDGGTLVVANGGIRTHPDYDREKLNLPDMRPNVSYLSFNGRLLDKVEPPEFYRQNSIRHLALRSDGLVAIAMQWQGSSRKTVPLLALHKHGDRMRFLAGPEQSYLKGYAGSVAFSGDGHSVAISAPRGNRIQVFDLSDTSKNNLLVAPDACGLASSDNGFVATSGNGRILAVSDGIFETKSNQVSYDNHLVKISI